MTNTIKNLLVALGIITVAFAGYYFFLQDSSPVLRTSESNRQLEQMLARTQEFVVHRQILDTIDLDTTILQSNEFRSLRTMSPRPGEFPVGRANPFVVTAPERPVTQITPTNDLPTDQE